MKITAIQSVKNKFSTTNPNQNKKDLTSFGVSVNPQQNEVASKKASEALKMNFLSKVSFGGQLEKMKYELVHYGCYSSSGQFYIGDNPSHFSSAEAAIESRKNWHLNSSIVHKTQDVKGVYFADPEEEVPTQIYMNNYVVYDSKTTFPDFEKVKKDYFSEKKTTGFREEHAFRLVVCKEMFNYYERLKKVHVNNLEQLILEKQQKETELQKAEEQKKKQDEIYVDNPWGDVPEDKQLADYYVHANKESLYFINEKIDYYNNRIGNSMKNQAAAAQLYSIFAKALHAFETRDKLAEEKDGILSPLRGYEYSKYDECLEQKKTELENKEKEFDVVNSWYNLRKEQIEEENSDLRTYPTTKEANKEELQKLENKVYYTKQAVERLQGYIANLETIPERMQKNQKEMQETMKVLAELYEEVEEFYNTHEKP